MADMALSRTAPPRGPALAAVAVAAGTALAGASLATPAAAAPALTSHAAASTLITVTVDSVPALSLNAFQGSYATSTVAQNGGDNSADNAQDPTGVLDRITLDQPAQSTTHSDPAKNWADAQPALEYTLNGKKLYSITSVDAHAECTPSAQGVNTYVHTAPNSVTVLGTVIGTGKTTVSVTGAQLGVTGVDHGSLNISYTTTTTQSQQLATTSAHAHMDLSISGVFYDSAGKQLYSGPLQKLRLGDVQVSCPTSGATSSAPTSSAVTPATSAGSSAPQAPSTAKGATDPTPDVHAGLRGRHGAHVRGNAKQKPGTAAPEDGPMLPTAKAANATESGGGDTSLWWALLSVLTLGCGGLLYFATRRRGRHQ